MLFLKQKKKLIDMAILQIVVKIKAPYHGFKNLYFINEQLRTMHSLGQNTWKYLFVLNYTSFMDIIDILTGFYIKTQIIVFACIIHAGLF